MASYERCRRPPTCWSPTVGHPDAARATLLTALKLTSVANRHVWHHRPIYPHDRRRRTVDERDSTNEVATKVRQCPCQRRQSFQPGTPSRQPSVMQITTLGNPGRVANPYGLAVRRFQDQCVNQRQVRIGLTAPSFSALISVCKIFTSREICRLGLYNCLLSKPVIG